MPERRARFAPLERLLHVKRVPMLAGLPNAEVAVLADAADERFFPAGALVLRDGEPAAAVQIVVRGSLATRRGGATAGRSGPGAAVGALALFAREPLSGEVVAEEDTLTLELDADALGEVLEDRFPILHHILRETSRRAVELLTQLKLDPAAGLPAPAADDGGGGEIDLVDRILFLRRMAVFRRSSITALAELGRAIAQVRFEAGTTLWREGEPGPGIFLLRSGTVRARSSAGVEFRAGAGFPLGALEALGELPRWYDAVAETPVVALQGHMGALVDVFEDNFDVALDYLAVVAQATLRIVDRARERGEPAPLP